MCSRAVGNPISMINAPSVLVHVDLRLRWIHLHEIYIYFAWCCNSHEPYNISKHSNIWYHLCALLRGFFLSIFCVKNCQIECFNPKFCRYHILSVKHFESQVRPHVLWNLIWIQLVGKGHQLSSKFTTSKQRVKQRLPFSHLIQLNKFRVYFCKLLYA